MYDILKMSFKSFNKDIKMFNFKGMFLILAVIFTAGCASLSTYQVAQTLAPGESTVGFSASQMAINVDLGVDSAGFSEAEKYTVPEVSYRVGIEDNVDVGLKVYPIAGVVDIKYQFLNKPKFDVAVDFGVGYTSFNNSFGGPARKITLVDLYPTLLLSYNIAPNISVTAAPKVIVRTVSGGAASTGTVMIRGGTLTFAFGAQAKGFRVMPEVGFYTLEGLTFTNLGVGLSW